MQGFGQDAYVTVTGISSCTDIGGGTIIRRLLPRTTDDIVVIGG